MVEFLTSRLTFDSFIVELSTVLLHLEPSTIELFLTLRTAESTIVESDTIDICGCRGLTAELIIDELQTKQPAPISELP